MKLGEDCLAVLSGNGKSGLLVQVYATMRESALPDLEFALLRNSASLGQVILLFNFHCYYFPTH